MVENDRLKIIGEEWSVMSTVDKEVRVKCELLAMERESQEREIKVRRRNAQIPAKQGT